LFLARDRSQKKVVLLFFTRLVPSASNTQKTDAPSGVLNLFLQYQYHVKMIPGESESDDANVPFWEQKGVEILRGEWYKMNLTKWLAENNNNISSIWFSDHELLKTWRQSLQDIFKERLDGMTLTTDLNSCLLNHYKIAQLQQALENQQKNMLFPPGHFYSPIVSMLELNEFENQLWEESENIVTPRSITKPRKTDCTIKRI